jgi:hypothetical protein
MPSAGRGLPIRVTTRYGGRGRGEPLQRATPYSRPPHIFLNLKRGSADRAGRSSRGEAGVAPRVRGRHHGVRVPATTGRHVGLACLLGCRRRGGSQATADKQDDLVLGDAVVGYAIDVDMFDRERLALRGRHASEVISSEVPLQLLWQTTKSSFAMILRVVQTESGTAPMTPLDRLTKVVEPPFRDSCLADYS